MQGQTFLLLTQVSALAAAIQVPSASTASADMDQSSGIWTLAALQAPLTSQWRLNLEADFRILDNFRETSQMMVQPAVLFHINKNWTVVLGYTLDVEPPSNNENRIIADGIQHFAIKDLVIGNRVRFNPRFIDNVGTVLRFRYRISLMWPIKQSGTYLHGWNEIFFNATKHDEGPVKGFEQNRLVAAVGFHFGDYQRAEIGYMWRPERRRGADTASDHIVAVSLMFRTAKKFERKPLPSETALPVAR